MGIAVTAAAASGGLLCLHDRGGNAFQISAQFVRKLLPVTGQAGQELLFFGWSERHIVEVVMERRLLLLRCWSSITTTTALLTGRCLCPSTEWI